MESKPSFWELLQDFWQFYAVVVGLMLVAFAAGGFITWLVMKNG